MAGSSRRLDCATYRAYAGDVADTSVRPPTAPPSGGGTAAVRKPRRRWLRWLLLGLLAGAHRGRRDRGHPRRELSATPRWLQAVRSPEGRGSDGASD